MPALAADAILLQRYHLIAPIADRGLGETWEGVDSRIEGRRVLVKVLDVREGDALAATLTRLQDLRMFRHPGSLAVTDHGVHEGRPFMVQDLPTTGSLATLLDRYRAGEVDIPLDKIAALIAKLAEVAQAGHEEPEPLIHGAIRPRAVMVSDDLDVEQAVLLDAGLRELGADPDAPKESAVAARCLTPEQFAGEPLAPRTDVFALGLLTLELLRAPSTGPAQPNARYVGRADVVDGVWDVVLLATRIPITERPSVQAFADLLAPAWTAPPPEAEAEAAEPEAPAVPEAAAPAPAPEAAPRVAPAELPAAAPLLAAEAPRYEPRSSIPPGGFLGAMPSLGATPSPGAMPSLGAAGLPGAPLAMPSFGTVPPPGAALPVAPPRVVTTDPPIEFGERTVALAEAPVLAASAPGPGDPLITTRKAAAPKPKKPVDEFEDHNVERTIVAFPNHAARMQAVDDMLSTVERGLPPELDAVAARFRAQMAATRRREDAPAGAMNLQAPRRPETPAAAPAKPATPAEATGPVSALKVVEEPEPVRPLPMAALIGAVVVAIAVVAALLLRH